MLIYGILIGATGMLAIDRALDRKFGYAVIYLAYCVVNVVLYSVT